MPDLTTYHLLLDAMTEVAEASGAAHDALRRLTAYRRASPDDAAATDAIDERLHAASVELYAVSRELRELSRGYFSRDANRTTLHQD
mgnify:CR=1 FL=1